MKYAQLIIGLLAGTALGGSVVAGTGTGASGAALDKDAVKAIVRDVINEEPKLILESVQKYQQEQQKQAQASASESLKDEAVRKEVFNTENAGVVGPKDSNKTVVEFFDYNCGACKMMFKGIETLVAKDKDVRVIFHEYPIFGAVSDANSKIGLAVERLYAEKYWDFHVKMMTHEGKTDEKVALDIAKGLGMDVEKLKAEAAKKEVADVIEANRKLGEKLHIQGTPTLVIGDEIIPHAMSPEELESRVNAIGKGDAKPAEAK